MSKAGDAIDVLIGRLISASSRSSKQGADLIQSAARGIVEHHSGRLAASITTTGPRPTGVASFATDVGPTVVYGRIHELGGHIYPHGHKYLAFYWLDHDLAPKLNDGRILVHAVYQRPKPYLKPATRAMAMVFRDRAISNWSDAIRSI